MKRATELMANLLAFIAGLTLVGMMVHVTLDVLLKYFFNQPIPGTAEVVAYYYMIGIVFLPLAYIEVQNRPIVVGLFYDLMPRALQAPLDVLGTVASLAFYAFLTWQSMTIALLSLENREFVDGIWKVVVWPSRFIIPLGLTIACAALLVRLVVLVRGGRTQHCSAEPN